MSNHIIHATVPITHSPYIAPRSRHNESPRATAFKCAAHRLRQCRLLRELRHGLARECVLLVAIIIVLDIVVNVISIAIVITIFMLGIDECRQEHCECIFIAALICCAYNIIFKYIQTLYLYTDVYQYPHSKNESQLTLANYRLCSSPTKRTTCRLGRRMKSSWISATASNR